MKTRLLFTLAMLAALLSASAGAQNPQPQAPQPQTQKPASADPYANNPDAGKTAFPLAAGAGQDSGAKKTAPSGAINQGAFDPATWKYGPAFNAPAGAKVWNPAKLKLQQGGR